MESIAGRFDIDWSSESLDAVTKTILKKYNAEIHSQSALEAAIELREQEDFTADEIEKVEIDVFDVAYHIIGGGEEGDKTVVRTKEEADHSLKYMIAVALIDGQVLPEQYSTERIRRDDVQSLLRKVIVTPDEELSRRFPREHACRLRIRLRDGRVVAVEKRDYEGFHTRPMSSESVIDKFERLSGSSADASLRKEIVGAVANLDGLDTASLVALLEQVGQG